MVLATLIVSAVSTSVTTSSPSFAEWAKAHGKTYATKEELVLRRSIYAANVASYEAHNAQNLSWTMGANKFSDLTGEEWKAAYTGGYRAKEKRSVNVDLSLLHGAAPPKEVDWTTKGAVTPVKNQGQCGSCWAFSTTGSTESSYFLAKGTLVSLSEQELVDCAGKEGNQGCNGGLMDYGFQYIIDNKGICTEASYPYTAKDGTCKSTTCTKSGVTVTGFTDVPTDSETALMAAIAQQPISIAIEADQASFQGYTGGVLTAACGTQLDHGVLAVGYGAEGTNDFYKVKNSWGADWGAKGYVMLGRGAKYNGNKGQCGIQMDPSFPKTA